MERHRMKTGLLGAGSHFSEDFDREVTRAFLFFHPARASPGDARLDRVVRQYDRLDGRGALSAPGARRLPDPPRRGRRLRPRRCSGRPSTASSPAPGRPSWRTSAGGSKSRRRRIRRTAASASAPTVAAEIPGLVIPLDFLDRREPGARPVRRSAAPPGGAVRSQDDHRRDLPGADPPLLRQPAGGRLRGRRAGDGRSPAGPLPLRLPG